MESYKQESPPQGGGLGVFTLWVLIIQVMGLISVILVAVWMGHFRGGFAWTEDPVHQFNYHPVFMVLGLIFLYANAILSYRVFRNVKKLYIKVLHASIHVAALIFAVVGLKAVFDFHNLTGKPNMYSLHSWIGISAVVLFGLQWVIGLITFLVPGLSTSLRTRYMPYHVFWGVAILCLAGAAVVTGITEKAIFHMSDIGYVHKSEEGMVLNCLGMAVIILIVTTIYVVTKPEYKRQPSPEEEHIQLRSPADGY